MEQVEVFSRPSGSHDAMDAGLDLIALSSVLRISDVDPNEGVAENDSATGVRDYMDVLVAEAIDRRQCAVLRLLLNNGADPGGAYRNKSHLIRAVTANDPELTKDLLHFGADVNAHEVNGQNALHVASANSSRDVMELLVDRGCHLEARDTIQGSTPLHVACTCCNRDAVLVLVEKGAEFNAVSDFGDTPLAKLLGPVTKAKDFHNEARLRLAEELVGFGFVLPPRSISKRISSDRPVQNLKSVIAKKKISSREERTQEKYRTPNESQPPVTEPLRHLGTDTTVGSCSYPPKRENMHRIFDRLFQGLSQSLSLKQLCRLKIIHALYHVPLKSSVPTLGLPKMVQNYIICGEKAVEARIFIEA